MECMQLAQHPLPPLFVRRGNLPLLTSRYCLKSDDWFHQEGKWYPSRGDTEDRKGAVMKEAAVVLHALQMV